MIFLRKPIDPDNLINAALVAIVFVAAVAENGLLAGSVMVAGMAYVVALMFLGFYAWRSIVDRRCRVAPIHLLVLGYILAYAAGSLVLGWRHVLVFQTAVGAMAPLVIETILSLCDRFRSE